MIGLGEVMSEDSYDMTAETMEPSLISFIERDQLMEFLQADKTLCLQIVRLLSETLHQLYQQYRTVGGPPSRIRKKTSTQGEGVVGAGGRRPPRPA